MIGRLISLMLAIVCLFSATTQAASASAATPSKLDESSAKCTSPGKKVSVLLVHGWNADPSIWGKTTDTQSLRGLNLPNVKVSTFSYAKYALHWVSHPAIGSALSQKINCLARASKKAGGKGKVVIVAHSMGGLATKRALALGGAGKYVDLVITMGTPYEGSRLSDYADNLLKTACERAGIPAQKCYTGAFGGMHVGSKPLKALPKWPKHTAVLALASDISINNAPIASDGVVAVDSAHAGGKDPRRGGGQLVYHCKTDSVLKVLNGQVSCSHGNLPKYGPIRDQVARSVARYVTKLRGPWVSAVGLKMKLGTTWMVTSKSESSARFLDLKKCAWPGGFTCAELSVRKLAKNEKFVWDPKASAIESYDPYNFKTGTRWIGDRKAKYFQVSFGAWLGMPGQKDTEQLWYLPKARILINASNASGVQKVLSGAVWLK